MIINNYNKDSKIKKILKHIIGLEKENDNKLSFEEKYKQDFYNRIDDANETRLFESIQIETVNRCNGDCPFCPVNRSADTRELAIMSDECFEKIINELSSIDYRGKIALFSNNEPLIDMKLEQRAHYAKKMCCNAMVYIYTNGTLLSVERFQGLEPWLDRIVIDNYNDKLVLNENIKPIALLCKKDERLDKKVEIHLRKINEVLYTRGGQSPNNEKQVYRDYPCFLPFTQMVIRPDGKVSLCCNDALGKMTLGDVCTNGLIEIWQSNTYRNIREMMLEKNFDGTLCQYCDSKHYN